MPVAPEQTTGDLMVAEEGILKAMEEFKDDMSARQDDIHPTIIKPLADITARVSLQNSIKHVEISTNWSIAAVLAIHNGNSSPANLIDILCRVMGKTTWAQIGSYLAEDSMYC